MNRLIHAKWWLLLPVLMLTGCHVFKSSETWLTVTRLKVPGRGERGSSAGYAQGLHHALAGKGIENRLVKFRYDKPDYPEPVPIIRWGVVYRDEANPKYPFWYMDSLVIKPVWLPNEPLARQLHFVVKVKPRWVAVSSAVLPEGYAKDGPADPAKGATAGWASLFEATNGTTYDPQSRLDREKMKRLQATPSRLK